MDKLNNNLEFCCSTLHQIVLVDQNSLFGIFSGGLSSCYHFCIWAALLAYLTHPSRQVPRKNIFWSIHHPRVLHFVQAVRLSICVVSPQHRQTDRSRESTTRRIHTYVSQTNKQKPSKKTQFFQRTKFVCYGPSVYYGWIILITLRFTISCADVHLVKSESHSFLSDITTRIRHYTWKICATGDNLICSVDIIQWYMQPLNSLRLHSSNFCILISKIPATMGAAGLHARTRKKKTRTLIQWKHQQRILCSSRCR